MKKSFALALCGAAALSLVACGGKTASTAETTTAQAAHHSGYRRDTDRNSGGLWR